MSTDSLVGTPPTAALAADALVAELFAAEVHSLVRLARIFCDDRDAAEDLVQEAFVRLHRSASTLRDPARAPAFLRSIVINLARDHNRRGLMSLRHQPAIRTEAHVSARPPDVERDAVADDENERMLAAVRMLPERQRACVVLCYYLELSEAEAAATLGISKNSIKTHRRRALEALQTSLEAGR